MAELNSPNLFSKVLLLEDELAFADALKISLKQISIHPVHVTTIAEAKKVLATKNFDFELLLLDRALPDGDGLEVLEYVQLHGREVFTLVLSAKSEVEDKIKGLNSGADDYIGKPFSWDELQARIVALQRRRQKSAVEGAAGTVLWKCDESRLRVFGPSGWVRLTPLEFKLVHHLLHARGVIVERAELLKKVWGFDFSPETRTVDYFIGRLRKTFEKDPESPRHFLTVRGAGYRFEP